MTDITPEQLMIPVSEDQMPEMGTSVIGYNPEWIHPDFNERGLRECFLYGDGSEWHTAKWIDGPDCYETTDGDKPTHWAPMLDRATSKGIDCLLAYINDPAFVRLPIIFKEKISQLCAAVENDRELPPIKYALLCGRLINEVRAMIVDSKGEGND